MFRLLVILLFYSCSTSAPVGIKSTDYELPSIPEDFSKINSQGADYALSHKRSGSIILLNSLCKKYDSTGLEILTENILTGLDELSIQSKKTSSYKDRDSIDIEAKGKMDGVLVYIHNKTFRRNHCTYDFTLISSQKLNEKEENQFYQFINNINFK